MSPEDLWEKLRARPFEPFRICLTDGTHYEIRHPELVLVTKRAALVGIGHIRQDPPVPDRATTVALLHIVRLEPLESQPQAQE